MAWNCPHCGCYHENIPKFCHSCRIPAPYTYIRCPKCRKETNAIVDRCPRCGQAFDEIKTKESLFETDVTLKNLNIQYALSGVFCFSAMASTVISLLIYLLAIFKLLMNGAIGTAVGYTLLIAAVVALTAKLFSNRRKLKTEIETELNRAYKRHLYGK